MTASRQEEAVPFAGNGLSDGANEALVLLVRALARDAARRLHRAERAAEDGALKEDGCV